MATIEHFNIPAKKPEQLKKFYQVLFDWEFVLLPGPQKYYLIKTNDLTGSKGIGGGMSVRESPEERIVNYVTVNSIDATLDKVKDLGGKILQPRKAVPGWGYTALCSDKENNLIGLWEEETSTRPQKGV